MMLKLDLFLCFAMILVLGGTARAEEFLVGEYRAYSILGEARLTPGTDYVSFTGDYGFSSRLPTSDAIERHLSHESKLLSNFALSVINLEIILPGVSGGELGKQLDNMNIDTLKKAGYDVVALANNHAMDHGAEGVSYNTTQLSRAGLAMIGTQDFPVYEWNPGGYRVVIYALTNDTDQKDPKRLILTMDETDLGLIRQKISQADFRIAFVHLGSMSSFLSPYERKQVGRLLDIGTDLVVSTGSHFTKGFVTERGRPVAYGIGNHLFSYVGSDTEPIGMHLVAGFRMDRLVQLFVVPFRNTILAGITGPLDETAFASFKKTLLERSNTDPDKYFSDPLTLDRLKGTLGRFSFSSLKDLQARHVVYATRIVLHHYPVGATTGLLLALAFFLMLARWTVNKHRQRKAVIGSTRYFRP